MSWLESILGGTDRFRSNFVKIASASLISQGLGLATLPLLTRLFSSEAFGVLTLYTMIQAILMAIVTGRVDWIIPNAKSERHARNLINLGFAITSLVCIVLAVIVLFFKYSIVEFFDLPRESIILELLPIALIAGSIQLILNAWFVFKGNLSAVGWSKLGQSAITILFSVAFGFTALKLSGLVLAYIAGFIAAAAILIIKTRSAKLFSDPRKTMASFRRFPFYKNEVLASVGLSLTNIIMTTSLVILIAMFYGNTVLGWYGLVFRMATAPIGLITTGLVQSFWSDAAILAKESPSKLRTFYISTTRRLLIMAIPFSLIFLAGPFYIPTIFGAEEWSGAGLILTAVTPYLFGMIVFSPTTHLIVYSKAHWQLACDLCTLVTSMLVFAVIAELGHSAAWAVFGSSTTMLLGYLIRFNLHLVANKNLSGVKN